MNFRIGFPVTREGNEPFAIWVATSATENLRGIVHWNGAQFPLDDAQFPDDFKNVAGRILESRDLYLFGPTAFNPVGDELAGGSYGLAMILALQFQIDYHIDGGVHNILLSGRARQENPHKPSPLGSAERLEEKIRFAADEGCSILILKEDYELLPSELALYNSKTPESRLPQSRDVFSEDLAARHRGRAYWLPIDISTGKWDLSGSPFDRHPWFTALGQFLGLTSVKVQQAAGRGRASSQRTDSESIAFSLSTASPALGTIGELYSKAIPYDEAYREGFLQHNADLCRRTLFAGGVATQALEKRAEIFFLPDVDDPERHILVSGPTACGKTFLAEAVMLNAVLMNQTAIYIAPTRALAKERHHELCKRFAFEGNKVFPQNSRGQSDAQTEAIVLSTGEVSGDDWRLNQSRFRIAVLVNEKANLFLRPAIEFLDKLGLVVIDELQFLEDPSRGGVLDMFLAKIADENLKRLRNNRPTIRIVGLTTESKKADTAFKPAFYLRSQVDGLALEPVTLKATERPESVTHAVRVYRQKIDPETVVVANLKLQEQIDIGRQNCRTLALTLASRINEMLVEEGADPNYIYSLAQARIVNEYINQGYHSILAASSSVAGLRNIAFQLRKLREDGGCVERVDDDLERLVRGGEIGQRQGKELLLFAKYGIYLHSSELPRKIRECVEEHFRRYTDRETERTEILLSTETLFYGVNLSADCVILLTPLWPRDEDLDIRYKFLTSNQFHNIMGRAGRPGFDCQNAKAVLCLPCNDLKPKIGDFGRLMQSYYGEFKETQLRAIPYSTLFLADDIRAQGEGAITGLNKVTYQSFRSVMDALRHMGGKMNKGSEVKDLLLLMRRTVFFQSKIYDEGQLAPLIKSILEAAAKEALVNASGNEYTITAQAEALIDTGTKWQSVAPMKAWIDELSRLKTEMDQGSGGGTRILPVEVLTPAFIASYDFWISARVFCWEWKSADPSPAAVTANEQELRKMVVKELRLLNLDETDSDAIESSLSRIVDRLRSSMFLPAPVDLHRKAILYRLLVATLMWLRGVDGEEINNLSRDPNEGGIPTRTFKDRYADRASWLATMCHRYFDKAGQLLPEHKRELPRLSERLRQGVLPSGLPLMAQRRSQLNRTDVQKLLENGATPAAILKASNPIAFLKDCRVLAEKGPNVHREVVEEVCEYYRNQIGSLASTLGADRTLAMWDRFEELMKGMLRQRGEEQGVGEAGREQIEEMTKLFCEMLSLQQRESGHEKLEVLKQSDQCSLKLRREGTINEGGLYLRVLACDAPLQTNVDGAILVRMPWARTDALEANAVHLTVCGAFVLSEMVGRRYIEKPVQRVHAWVQSQLGLLKSVKDIVTELTMPHLLPGQREALLRFNEPGIEEKWTGASVSESPLHVGSV